MPNSFPTYLCARVFLGFNAGFSILTGFALILFPDFIAEIMLTKEISWISEAFVGLGVLLLGFAVSLVVLVRDRFLSKPKIVSISAADVGWVVSSGVVLLLFSDFLTSKGVAVIIGVNVFVAVFALGQFMGARVTVAA
ncbi:hypothetical protein WH96_12685 [Kiloniella spongiae]|uniref:Major facilitator superfamily (MFS) profile domain-containing protein n=1 Tax=Kiloniella spongiae TaxID=1489064 RepID=A0A0H2MDV9_9PROT|nr:hypothetical protein [Kiloniella spongiae]KLN60548.1 hypothetical protein WH96_12685 [Kiloniella spongiae]